MNETTLKPTVFMRPGGQEWCCITKGDPHSRMGTGPSPKDAYNSWALWGSAMGESICRLVDQSRVESLETWIALSRASRR